MAMTALTVCKGSITLIYAFKLLLLCLLFIIFCELFIFISLMHCVGKYMLFIRIY